MSVERVTVYCEGRPDRSGQPTHERWEVQTMIYTATGTWQPSSSLDGGTQTFAGEVVTLLEPDNSHMPTKDEFMGSLRYQDDPARYTAALEEFAALRESARIHHSFRCLIPMEQQRRGCGLNVPSGDFAVVRDILTKIAAAGVSEISLLALAGRVNPTRRAKR